MRHQEDLFLDVLLPAFAAHGISLQRGTELDHDDRKHLDEVFDERVFPVLTPLGVDPAHPFPYISNLSLNLAVWCSTTSTPRSASPGSRCPRRCPGSSACRTASGSSCWRT